jgi:uncharacterized membrane protein
MKTTNKKQIEEMTIHAIIADILLNGFIQGKEKIKLDSGVLKEAQKQIERLIRQAEKRGHNKAMNEILDKLRI